MTTLQDIPAYTPDRNELHGNREPEQHSIRKVPARIGYVDSLRALAAIYVVMHHTWLTIWQVGYNIMPRQWEMVTLVLQYGHFAVSVFIVLSGYSLMLPVMRHGGFLKGGYFTFILRRARRILPTYWSAVIFSAVCIALLVDTKHQTIWDVSIPVYPINFVTHLWMINDIVRDSSINYVFWSIAVEWRIYFLFPLFVFMARRYGYFFLMLFWGTGFGAFFLLHQTYQNNLWLGTGFTGFPITYIGLFCLGMIAAKVSYGNSPADVWLRSQIRWQQLVVSASLALLGYFVWLNPAQSTLMTNEQMAIADLIIGFIVPALLITLSDPHRDHRLQWLEWRPLVAIGGFSYSLYLIHAPLVQIMWQYIVHPLHQGRMVSFILLLCIDLPIIVLTAKLFSLCCEKPFLQSHHNTSPKPLFQRQPA